MTISLVRLGDAVLAVIEASTTYYVGMLEEVPDEDDANEVEVSVGGYARVAVPNWLTSTILSDTERVKVRTNQADINFAEITASTVIKGVGIWTDLVAGDLIYWTRFAQDVPLIAGSVVSFNAGSMRVGIGDPFKTNLGDIIVKIEATAQTTDAVPLVLADLGTIVDLTAVHIESEITGTDAAGQHYYRKHSASYDRDDGGGGSDTWVEREITTEGTETRRGFTTATAAMELVGDQVRAEVTGEAATTVTWKITAEVRSE